MSDAQKATSHVWHYLKSGMMGESEEGPFAEKEFIQLLKSGTIKETTAVFSPSRTRGKWIKAGSIKSLANTIKTGTAKREATKQAQAEESKRARDEIAETKRQQQQQPTGPHIGTPLNSPPSNSDQIVWSGRPSQINNLKTFLLCGLFCWLVIPIFYAVWKFLEIRTVKYELTSERLRFSHGVVSRHLGELELYRVKDTAMSQTFFQRLFGLATIRVITSDATSPVVYLHSIPLSQATQLRETIRQLTEQRRDQKRVREVDFG